MATRRRTNKAPGSAHRFGGDWTQTKLAIVSDYLGRYTTALKNTPFKTAYIDAFAGSGYLTHAETSGDDDDRELFADLAAPDQQRWLDGSARIALKTEPRFGKYIFIEKRADFCLQLEALKGEFPLLGSDIDVRQGEANKEIRALCSKDWRSRRAVLFLDPYGMQVEWSTRSTSCASPWETPPASQWLCASPTTC